MNADEFDVAIVGAGAAGLIAARTLTRAGRRVLVLEALGSVGGRMLTRDAPGAGAPIEFAAEFVHGSRTITRDLLRESGNDVVDVAGSSWIRRGGIVTQVPDDAFEAAEALLAPGIRLDHDCSVDALLERAVAEGADAAVAARTRALVAGFDAADPARASARAIAEEWAGDASADGTQSRPILGYGHLAQHLAGSLDTTLVTMRTGMCVTGVTWSDTAIVLDANSIDRQHRFYAKSAIVTVPLGVLQANVGRGAITFSPELPESHKRAMALLEMGPVVKVVLTYATPFWETIAEGRYRDAAFFSTEGAFPTVWTQAPIRANILTAWAGGPAAAAMRDLGEEKIVAAATSTVATLFDERPEARRVIHSDVGDWTYRPLARGAYSYALVGAGDARARLARPVGPRLLLAGEATARDAEGGTVTGALESGIRAANQLLETLFASADSGFARRY